VPSFTVETCSDTNSDQKEPVKDIFVLDSNYFSPYFYFETDSNQFFNDEPPPDPNQEHFFNELPFLLIEDGQLYDFGSLLIHCMNLIDILSDTFHRAGTILAKVSILSLIVPLNKALKKELERDYSIAFSEINDTITNVPFSITFKSVTSLISFMRENINEYFEENFISNNIGMIVSTSHFSTAIHRFKIFKENHRTISSRN